MTYKRRLKKSVPLKLGLGFLFFLAVLTGGSCLWRSAGRSQWPSGADFSWITQSDQHLRLYTLMPEYSKLIIWEIPGNTLVKTADNFGQYQWKNVFSLGEIGGRGGEILARTSQDNLGLMVMGWRYRDKTNLSWWDELRLWWWQRFKVKDRLMLDLSRQPGWQPDSLADGSQVFRLIYPQVDELVNSQTFSARISRENLSVTVVNASGEPQGGETLARILANHGLEVAVVVEAIEPRAKTTISAKNKEGLNSQSAAWLKTLLPPAETIIAGDGDYWSDLAVFVGSDYTRLP